MGLETQFLYIDDLNVDNPANTDGLNQADNHLRGIKNVLTNQFPNLGDAIITATAAEISDVANKLTSFNGRTGPAILPAAGDYDINDLGDVDTTGLTNGDALVYNSTSGNFEPQAVAVPSYGQALLTGTAGTGSTASRAYYFSSVDENNIPAATATLNNDSVNGFYIEAVVDCFVNISFTTPNDEDSTDYYAIALDGSKTTLAGSQASGVIRAASGPPSNASFDVASSISCAVLVSAGSQVWVNVGSQSQTSTDAICNVLVQAAL